MQLILFCEKWFTFFCNVQNLFLRPTGASNYPAAYCVQNICDLRPPQNFLGFLFGKGNKAPPEMCFQWKENEYIIFQKQFVLSKDKMKRFFFQKATKFHNQCVHQYISGCGFLPKLKFPITNVFVLIVPAKNLRSFWAIFDVTFSLRTEVVNEIEYFLRWLRMFLHQALRVL